MCNSQNHIIRTDRLLCPLVQFHFHFYINDLVCVGIIPDIQMVFSKLFCILIGNLRSPCAPALQICGNIQPVIVIHGGQSLHNLRSINASDIYKAVLGQIAVLYQQKALLFLFLHHFPVTLYFPKLLLNPRDKLRCCPADRVKGRFQFFHVTS